MSMSAYVVAFRPPDQRWKTMKAVWDACAGAGVELPKEVSAFFNHDSPDDAGVKVDLLYPERHECVREYNERDSEGYEIDVTKLPPGVTILRFYNS